MNGYCPNNTITRQIMLYDNGFRLRYGPDHLGDDYGEVLWDVSLDECDTPPGEEITREEFEAVWNTGPWTNDPTEPVAADVTVNVKPPSR